MNSIQQTLTAAFLSAVLDGLMNRAPPRLIPLYKPPLAAIALPPHSPHAPRRWDRDPPVRNAPPGPDR
ncbi:hypothetical protein LH496_27325, partial [Klebsiella pneumoniae]|uniref:hypothetical protein n=1 Tax=Klebsiella pneumoniae TaxID=573 RepID=UPI001E629C1D